MKDIKCTIYDCEFDHYVEGVISANKVFAKGYLNKLIPAKTSICQYVDYGMVQFFVGEYDRTLNTGDAKWGYFNLPDGEIIVPPVYDKAYPFYRERACVILEDKYGFLDPHGNIAVDLIWDDSYNSFRQGLCPVKRSFLWGYIDEDGNTIVKARFEEAEPLERIKQDLYLARVKKDGKYGCINEEGVLTIQPCFELLEKFSLIKDAFPTALIKKNGKYGYIDDKGYYIFEPFFEKAKTFWRKGFAPVMIRGVWGFIDIYGDTVVPFQFQQVGNAYFKDEFYTVQKNNQWGIIDEHLNIIMPEKDVRYVMYKDKKIYLKDGEITSSRKYSVKRNSNE